MKGVPLAVIVLIVPCALLAIMSAQERGQQSALAIVEVVGCLAEAPNNAWILTDATDPVVTKTVFTTKEALVDAENRPLGNQRYRLLGVRPFSPDNHKGHKMAAKGVLIKDPKESRLNVTSLQMVGAACAK